MRRVKYKLLIFEQFPTLSAAVAAQWSGVLLHQALYIWYILGAAVQVQVALRLLLSLTTVNSNSSVLVEVNYSQASLSSVFKSRIPACNGKLELLRAASTWQNLCQWGMPWAHQMDGQSLQAVGCPSTNSAVLRLAAGGTQQKTALCEHHCSTSI